MQHLKAQDNIRMARKQVGCQCGGWIITVAVCKAQGSTAVFQLKSLINP